MRNSMTTPNWTLNQTVPVAPPPPPPSAVPAPSPAVSVPPPIAFDLRPSLASVVVRDLPSFFCRWSTD